MGLSTHILTRRMTVSTLYTGILYLSFNSHPHKEDDKEGMSGSLLIGTFNSHPHKEDDHFPLFIIKAIRTFNSHPHKEDDQQGQIQ